MPTGQSITDQYFLQMRERCLSLAADFDRIGRAEGGLAVMKSDPRLLQLRQAIQVLLSAEGDRAGRVQMILSDMTPPPPRE